MAKKDRSPIPALRVVVKGVDPVICAGHRWAGESLVPLASYTAADIQALRQCDALTVEDAEIAVAGD